MRNRIRISRLSEQPVQCELQSPSWEKAYLLVSYCASSAFLPQGEEEAALALGSPKTMKRLVLATVLHVATTNNCERATDLKPEHICRAALKRMRCAVPYQTRRTRFLCMVAHHLP